MKARNKWTDVVFTLNVVFFQEAVYGGSLDEDKEQMDSCRICIECRFLLRRPCTEVLDKDGEQMMSYLHLMSSFTEEAVFGGS
jgi:hypothetical protein